MLRFGAHVDAITWVPEIKGLKCSPAGTHPAWALALAGGFSETSVAPRNIGGDSTCVFPDTEIPGASARKLTRLSDHRTRAKLRDIQVRTHMLDARPLPGRA